MLSVRKSSRVAQSRYALGHHLVRLGYTRISEILIKCLRRLEWWDWEGGWGTLAGIGKIRFNMPIFKAAGSRLIKRNAYPGWRQSFGAWNLENEDVTGKMTTEHMYQRADPKVHSLLNIFEDFICNTVFASFPSIFLHTHSSPMSTPSLLNVCPLFL